MKILVDLNVMLDFLERRESFFEDAASVLDRVLNGNLVGVLPAHGVTTLYYFLAKTVDPKQTQEFLRWMLANFEIGSCDASVLTAAIDLGFDDYEDAVTAVIASRTGCEYIVTRNRRDFDRSPTPALAPGQFLTRIDAN
ncbi:MAG: PIN domain-containing protein [Candidatus Hydrogenedentota bacterium]